MLPLVFSAIAVLVAFAALHVAADAVRRVKLIEAVLTPSERSAADFPPHAVPNSEGRMVTPPREEET
jgi:hypothetical protein